MPSTVRIDSATDDRLGDYLALTDVELRRRREPADGIFIAEGEKVIRRALEAGYELRSVLLSEKWLPTMAEALPDAAQVFLAAEDVLEQITGYAVHRGALAAFERKPLPNALDLVATASRVAILEGVNDHTNIGAIFRGAAALGMEAVLLDPTCADPLYRRAVKVSMGSVFAVPYARLEPWPQALDDVRAAGLELLALTPDPGALPLQQMGSASRRRCAVLLGAEGPGLSASVLVRADHRVRIPMAHGVDSLNVGAAAAVAFYAFCQT